MSKPLIMVSSITYAMKSRDILLNDGIKAYVERLPSSASTGCGYSIYVPNRTDEAEKILTELGIRILGRAERDGTA
nr:DUF3343 domain-containing protein [uncultured Caproiciproducens sp.]